MRRHPKVKRLGIDKETGKSIALIKWRANCPLCGRPLELDLPCREEDLAVQNGAHMQCHNCPAANAGADAEGDPIDVQCLVQREEGREIKVDE